MARDSAASGGTVERELEARAVSDLLDRAEEGPAGLLVEGEAGIGKTTLVLDAADRAVHRGFRVPARGSPSEVSYAYAAVADLASGIDHEVQDALPGHRIFTANERESTGIARCAPETRVNQTRSTAVEND